MFTPNLTAFKNIWLQSTVKRTNIYMDIQYAHTTYNLLHLLNENLLQQSGLNDVSLPWSCSLCGKSTRKQSGRTWKQSCCLSPFPFPGGQLSSEGKKSEARQEETIRMSIYPRPPINETFDIPCKLLQVSTKPQCFIHNFYRKCFTVSHRSTIRLVELGKKLSLYQLGFECSGISELETDRSSLPGKEGVSP